MCVGGGVGGGGGLFSFFLYIFIWLSIKLYKKNVGILLCMNYVPAQICFVCL